MEISEAAPVSFKFQQGQTSWVMWNLHHNNEVIKIKEDPTTLFLHTQAPRTNFCQLMQEVECAEIKTC